MTWICSECGGNNVQVKAWINPNTDEIVDLVSDEIDECWCDDCEKHNLININKD